MVPGKYNRYFGGRAQDRYDELVRQHGESAGKRMFFTEMNTAKVEKQRQRRKKNRKKKR